MFSRKSRARAADSADVPLAFHAAARARPWAIRSPIQRHLKPVQGDLNPAFERCTVATHPEVPILKQPMRAFAVAIPRGFIAALCAIAAVSSPAWAQVSSGAMTGIVRDQAGAPVPGATVTVTNRETGRQRIVATTPEGVYTAPGLLPGTYRIEVQLAGFKPLRREGVQAATGQTIRLDFELSVGDVREQVTVRDDAPLLRAESASLGAVIGNGQVVQLPLNG
jgi:hypothetical protein